MRSWGAYHRAGACQAHLPCECCIRRRFLQVSRLSTLTFLNDTFTSRHHPGRTFPSPTDLARQLLTQRVTCKHAGARLTGAPRQPWQHKAPLSAAISARRGCPAEMKQDRPPAPTGPWQEERVLHKHCTSCQQAGGYITFTWSSLRAT